MRTQRSSSKPLVTILRRRSWKILKKFIPPASFIETNLPAIRIEVQDREAGASRSWSVDYEEASLALSMYIPGRPLFRVGGLRGAIVPIIRRRRGSPCTIVNECYELEDLPVGYELLRAMLSKLPDELIYFLNSHNMSPNAIDVKVIDKVKPYHFYGAQHCYQWFSWSDGGMFTLTDNVYKYMFRTLKERNYVPLRIVAKESNSFGRYHVLEVMKGSNVLEGKLKEVIGSIGLGIAYLSPATDLVKMLYAVDYRVKVFKWRISDEGQLWNVLKSKCIDARSESLRRLGLVRGLITSVRIPCLESRYGARSPRFVTPVLMGYQIKSTTYLSLDSIESLRDFVYKVLENYEELAGSDALHDLYTMLTLNEVLLNVLKFYLTSDLTIVNAALSNRINVGDLVELALTYADLYHETKISDMIHKHRDLCEEFLRKLIAIIQTFVEKLLREDPEVLVLRYVVLGVRTLIPRSKRLDEITTFLNNVVLPRLKDALCTDGDWRAGVLRDVLRHTLSHHLIRIASETSRTPINYLGEIYDVAPSRFETGVEVFETVSGGIGAIETLISIWSRDHMRLVEDLILKLGECLVGTPEDVVYFTLVNELNKHSIVRLDSNFDKFVRETMEELRIVVTPEEYIEIGKVYNALIEEARRIDMLINTDHNHDRRRGERLLTDVMKLRYECEKHVKRFCSVDEILVFALKNLNRFGSLKRLLVELTKRYLEVRRDVRAVLSRFFSIVNTAQLAEHLVDELVGMSNGRRTDLYNVYRGVYRTSAINRKLIRTVITDVGRIFRASTLKLLLKSCEAACGLCYLNIRSCRFSAPWIQMRVLNRRLAKLYASYLITTRLIRSVRFDLSELSKFLGKVSLGSDKHYLYLPARL